MAFEDKENCKQLKEAGLKTYTHDNETMGSLYNWRFIRGRSYWIAKGPGIPLDKALRLQESHGKVVRADGDCRCRGPLFWNKGFGTGYYHVDSLDGLKALVSILNEVVQEANTL